MFSELVSNDRVSLEEAELLAEGQYDDQHYAVGAAELGY
jgi:hypothetical protein